jgi:hypothetical protein
MLLFHRPHPSAIWSERQKRAKKNTETDMGNMIQTETESGKWRFIGTKKLNASDIYQEEGIQTDKVIQLNIK